VNKTIFSVLIVLLLFGCGGIHNVQIYGSIDNNNKTVTVPPGSDGLKGKLKEALSQDGWKLFVYRGPSVTEGEIGEKTKVQQYETFNTKYRLVVSSYQFDVCILPSSPAIRYDISFIDNDSGTEVFTINGRSCESEVVEKFTNALKGTK
jgi:hypothetical protein